jgi:hypothetical protein
VPHWDNRNSHMRYDDLLDAIGNTSARRHALDVAEAGRAAVGQARGPEGLKVPFRFRNPFPQIEKVLSRSLPRLQQSVFGPTRSIWTFIGAKS